MFLTPAVPLVRISNLPPRQLTLGLSATMEQGRPLEEKTRLSTGCGQVSSEPTKPYCQEHYEGLCEILHHFYSHFLKKKISAIYSYFRQSGLAKPPAPLE